MGPSGGARWWLQIRACGMANRIHKLEATDVPPRWRTHVQFALPDMSAHYAMYAFSWHTHMHVCICASTCAGPLAPRSAGSWVGIAWQLRRLGQRGAERAPWGWACGHTSNWVPPSALASQQVPIGGGCRCTYLGGVGNAYACICICYHVCKHGCGARPTGVRRGARQGAGARTLVA